MLKTFLGKIILGRIFVPVPGPKNIFGSKKGKNILPRIIWVE